MLLAPVEDSRGTSLQSLIAGALTWP
jgi:hypothetical protein